MLKQIITYTDFNGEEVTEAFYFNLTKAELIELELMREGGLSDALKRIVATEDGKQIITEFKNIIMISYGKKSEDGRRFIKNQAVLDEFMSSEAYSEFFMMLITEEDAAANFIKTVIPQALVDEVTAAIDSGEIPEKTEDTTDNMSSDILTEESVEFQPEIITRSKLNTMSTNDKARVMVSVEKGEVRIDENN